MLVSFREPAKGPLKRTAGKAGIAVASYVNPRGSSACFPCLQLNSMAVLSYPRMLVSQFDAPTRFLFL